jgi:hypothetical protein
VGAQSNASWRLPEVILVAAGLIVFLALALYQIQLPGLHYDEAREAGLPALQILRGLPVDAFRGAGIRIGPVLIPLMLVDYIGATNVALALPFLTIGGPQVAALRALPVSLSVIALLLLYAFARQVYNRRVAAAAFLLLAVNPSFVFWSRQGIFVTSTIIPLSLGAALCLVRWYRQGSRLCLWLGMFLLGLGLYTKFIFLWIIVAYAVAFALFEGPRLLKAVRGRQVSALPYPLGWPEIGGAALAFLAGMAPLILYNLQTGGTFNTIGQNLTTSYYGTNNLAFWQNLNTRWTQLVAVLTGGHLWYLGGIFENMAWLYVAGAALFGAAIALALRRGRGIRRALLPWLICAVILLLSCFTVSALWPTHFAILAPWPPLALAVSLDLVSDGLRHLTPRARRETKETTPVAAGFAASGSASLLARLPWLLVVLLILLDVRLDMAYHHALARSGGLAGHTSAIYDLAAGLEARGLAAPVAMDWGMAAQVEFLTAGRVRPIEVFGYDWNVDKAFGERLTSFLDNPDSVYVFHSPAETVFPRREAFDALVSSRGQTTTTEEVYRQKDGKPMFTLVRVSGQ